MDDKGSTKIVALHHNADAVAILEQMVVLAKENKLGGFIFAGFVGAGGNVITTKNSVSAVEQSVLIAHLNNSAILDTVRENSF